MTSPDAATDTALSGADLRHALQVAELWLEANREALNAINVYPVPDGDTGTNMLLTLRAANAALPESGGAGAIGKALADAALLGARGNSGVILSQMLRGFADALEGVETLGAPELRSALTGASEMAYSAVPEPVEGTMLTVMREARRRQRRRPTPRSPSTRCSPIAVEEAEASVERTPDLLPRLREAGVVDAGGQGVAVLLAGLLYGVRGEPLPEPPPAPTGEVDLGGVEHEGHGYCVEYIVQGVGLERTVLAAALTEAQGESVLVVGDPSALRVHVHMEDPGVALSAGAAHGGLQMVKVDNMQAQHESWAAAHEDAEDDDAPPPPIGLVAVVQGPGLTAHFRDLGVTRIVSGGATNNPSAGELLEAARRAGRERVFILPERLERAARRRAGGAAGAGPDPRRPRTHRRRRPRGGPELRAQRAARVARRVARLRGRVGALRRGHPRRPRRRRRWRERDGGRRDRDPRRPPRRARGRDRRRPARRCRARARIRRCARVGDRLPRSGRARGLGGAGDPRGCSRTRTRNWKSRCSRAGSRTTRIS